MIFITNKHRPSTDIRIQNATKIYCGRGSPLGNPFHMRDPADRDAVCNRYAHYFEHSATPGMVKQLAFILEEALKGDVALECYCTPKRCHCETIKAHVEKEIY